MAIIDYQILNKLDINTNELSNIFHLNSFNINKSFNSDTSFFTCDRLIRLYNELTKSNDIRRYKINDELTKLFNYSVKYPVLETEEFINQLDFKYGIIITEIKTEFCKNIIKKKCYESLGIITNNHDIFPYNNVQVLYENLRLLIPVTFFIYIPKESEEVIPVFNIGLGVYTLRDIDIRLAFNELF